MIKYNINLKTIIPVLSFVFVLTIFIGATNALVAQIPPKTTLYPVGLTQTPGGPPVADYDPAVTAEISSVPFLMWHDYYVKSIGAGDGYPVNYNDLPPINGIPCQFPPILETSNSTAMIVYKQAELGIGPMTMTKMKFSALYDLGPVDLSSFGHSSSAYLPYNLDWVLRYLIWWELDQTRAWRLSGSGFFNTTGASQIPDPTPVEIYIKNGAAFTERGTQPVDKSFPTSEGWVKVYDGYYDHLDTTQWDQITPHSNTAIWQNYRDIYTDGIVYEPIISGTIYSVILGANTAAENKGFNVSIPFARPFEYTGGDITIAFVNPAERRGMKTDIYNHLQDFYIVPDDAGNNWAYRYDWLNAGALINLSNPASQVMYPATYRFRCYAVKDSDVGGAYLGPKFQVGSQQPPRKAYYDYDSAEVITQPWPDYGLTANYFDFWKTWNTINTKEWLTEWSGGTVTEPTEYIQPYSSTELTYSLPLISPFLYDDGLQGSVKPKIGFEIEVQSLVTSQFETGADFKPSKQTIYLPGSTLPNDNQQVVGEFTVYADNNGSRLALKQVGFNLTGTDNRLGTIVLAVYRDASSTGLGNISTSELVVRAQVPDNITNWNFPLSDVADLKLNAGENRFFFVFELDESKTFCQAPMSMTLNNFVLGNREFIDTDLEYTIDMNKRAIRPLSLMPVDIINTNNDQRTKILCLDENAAYQTLQFDAGTIQGKYESIEWYYSTDNAQTWTKVAGAQSVASITLPVNKDITNYSCRVVYDATTCAAIKDTEIWNIIIESEIESVDFSYEGKLPHNDYEIFEPGVIQGDLLNFAANATFGDRTVPIYRWELSSDNGSTWQSIGNSSMLNYIVPAGMYGTQILRVTAFPDPTVCACRTSIQSKEFRFYVRPQKIDFNFVNNLPAYRLLCANDTVTLSVTYSGTIDEKNSWWEKDGEKFYVNGQLATHRVLKLVNTDKSVLGSYRYRVKARVFDPSVDVAPYWADMLTTTCVVDATPILEIFQRPQSNNYITAGVPVILLVETSLIDEESAYQGYQWYKHTVNGDIRLTDNTYRFGSTSNQLVLLSPTNTSQLNALSRDVYTFNGEYYYLQITGPCDTITTGDHPIHILPSENLQLIEDAQNAVVCVLGERVTYTVKANDAQGIDNVQYQWYIDGVQATDNGDVSGSQTSSLTINPILDENTEVYCEVSATVFGVNSTINSRTATVEYSYLQNLETQSYINDVSLLVNLNWETNDLDAANTVNIYLNDNLWVTEELAQGVDMSTVRTHQLNIPLDAKFALLLIDNPETLNILVEVSNECGNMVSEQTSISVKDVVIEPAVPADIADSQNADAFDILPNPVNDIVTIGFSSNVITQTTIDICDLSGQTIANLFTGDCQKNYNKLNFNLNNLNIATGTYIIRITNSEGTKSKHFVFAK